MPIMVTYKFEENAIKNKSAMSVTSSKKDFFQGQVTLGEWFDLATLRTVRDFMSAVVTCTFEEPIKTEGTMPGTRSKMGFIALNSK